MSSNIKHNLNLAFTWFQETRPSHLTTGLDNWRVVHGTIGGLCSELTYGSQ